MSLEDKLERIAIALEKLGEQNPVQVKKAVAVEEIPKATPVVEVEEKPKKKVAKKKTVKKEEKPVEEPLVEEELEEPVKAKVEATLEQCKKVLINYIKKHGMDEAKKKMFDNFKVPKLSDVGKKDYEKVLEVFGE